MKGNELSNALRSGKRIYGTCVTAATPGWPAAIASLGIDLAFIDSEHTPLGRDQLSWMCHAYLAQNVVPVVRIPEPDPYRACMVLDGGAQGVIVPYVESAAQVRELRGAVKLRPLKGERLYNVLEGKEELGDELTDYLGRFNKHNVLIVNIESVAAIEALDEILAEPGLDAVLVGPHDLSINLNVPEQYDHPNFMAAISTIISKARAAGVGAGIHFFTGIEKEIQWAKEGANLIMHSSDKVAVLQTLHKEFKHFHDELGDTPDQEAKPEDGIV